MESKLPSEINNVFTPRAYQIDLYERAVDNNMILYLPTGAGKTYIAVMLLKHLSAAIRKPYQEGGKRSIFVVNTVALVEQQSAYISRHTDLTCKGYSGDMKVDFWQEQQWLTEIEEHQVLVMTSQIFLNLLMHGSIKLDRINLIMFDECHRAVSNHPMRQIMQKFEDCPKENQPRILAMSATLLNANIKETKIETTIRALEITFHAKIATVESTDCIQGYCTNPKEDIVEYENYLVPKELEKIIHIINVTIEILKHIRLSLDELYYESSTPLRPKTKTSKLSAVLKDIESTMSQAGIYGGSKSALLHLIQLESLKRFSTDQMTNTVIDYLITQVTLIRKLFDNEMKGHTELERLYHFSSNQIYKLFGILLKYHELSEQKFCCIIFVKERFMTQVIYHILKTLSANDKQYSFLLPDYVLGFQNNPYKNSREVSCIAKWNKEVLQRFKNGSANCIVATDVVDEGIDIPTCTLIIRYDMPTDFRAYVQSKGRARHSSSCYVILKPINDTEFLKRYLQYKSTEETLKGILVGQTEQRTLPTEDDIVSSLYTDFEIKPYLVKRDGVVQSRLTENDVINLINSYCSSLLTSKFVCLVPVWKLYQAGSEDTLFRISLKLPSLSPVKTKIYGDYMKSIDGAKRSAAMKTCIKLYENGILSDKLLPVTNDEIMQNLNFLFPNWIDEDNYLSGTYKRKREHELEHPLAFYSAYPQPSQLLYLHVISTSMYPVTSYDNRRLVFYDLLNEKSGFGILSTKSLPKIPSFPIFMKDGKLMVDVKSDHATMMLSESDIELLKRFHFLLFSDIITVIKSFMIFDNENRENSFLIVPLNDKQEIDWNAVKTYQHLEQIMPCKPFHFKSSDYELALVTPTYRGSGVYVVTRVCDDLTPESCFPNEDFETFTHYYKEKHRLIIENLEQSMLEVKPIPIKINYIKPRKLPEGPLKYKKTDDTVEDLQEHLIPELCRKINFPAMYWLKATTLPSILHRICQFLIAEDLRVTIARDTRLGMLSLKELSPLKIEEDVEKLSEEDYSNGLELMDDLIEKTESDQTYSDDINDINVFDLDCNPFLRDQEPRDLYRNIDQIQMIDIQYYNQFMSVNCDEDEDVEKTKKKSVSHYIQRSVISAPSLNILISDEQSFSQGPNSAEIMHALTTKLGLDMFNLERLETLGDSYLKFIVSLFLYHRFPTFNEGQLTALKGKIIGNRNLYYCGKKKGIPGRIKNDAFVPMSNFIPPAFTVLRPLQTILLNESVAPNVLYEFQIPEPERFTGYIGEDTRDTMMQTVMNWDKGDKQTGVEHYLGVQILSDKTVADSVEALIGVYLKSNGIKGAAKLLKWFGILPDDLRIDELLDSNSHDPVLGTGNPNHLMPWAGTMEIKLGYKFKNRAFLLQAFTHPSFTANGITECYQRLEFLGDAILDFLITCYIYENCGNLSPGDLTDLRSALVNNITFACLSVRYGLHTALLAYAPKLHEIVDRFVKFQEERDYVINDELLYVLLEEDECNLVEYVDAPKVLGDLFESVIGAIYLDSGKNLMKVWEIIYSFMHKEIDAFSKNIPKQPVRVIYENTDIRPKFLDATLIKGTDRVMIPLKITIAGKETVFYGFGGNKKQAKCAAAKQALKRLQLEK